MLVRLDRKCFKECTSFFNFGENGILCGQKGLENGGFGIVTVWRKIFVCFLLIEIKLMMGV